jgi:hypothetical protein
MHSSLHNILAVETVRVREADARKARLASSIRRPLAAFATRVARAHGIPPRAAPGQPASLRGH